MRKIFIDCGANLGVVLADFIRKLPEHEFYAFEPNPDLLASIRGEVARTGHAHVTVFDQAVWTHNGTANLYLGHHESSTLLLGKRVPPMYDQQIDYMHPVQVPCIDFSAWLADETRPGDEVTVKMDIEGAEYPVLRKMIDDGTLELVSVLYVEWHYNRFPGMSLQVHEELVAAVSRTVEVRPWD